MTRIAPPWPFEILSLSHQRRAPPSSEAPAPAPPALAPGGSAAVYPGYSPARLLDAVILDTQLANDSALARMLKVDPPLISKVRHRRLPLNDALLQRIHKVTGMSFATLWAVMGERRAIPRKRKRAKQFAARRASAGMPPAMHK